MRRSDLEHLIRAAGVITGSRRLLIIGSQSILGQFPAGAPELAMISMEADMLPLDAPDKTDLLTGTIGELSAFHDSWGYFADGISLETAILPRGWESRLVPIENQNTKGSVGLCLEVHDLLLSKYAAAREKDREFCRAVVLAGLVERRTLMARLAELPVTEEASARICSWIELDFDKLRMSDATE
jgi:hypothetical protein